MGEEDQILEEFTDTINTDYPKDKTIIDLFEEQVNKTPENTAIVFEDQHLTYKELNERSNQLAHYLRSKGVKEETFVPICIERRTEMIIGILGILKAGGVYVPVDPDYPEERIKLYFRRYKSTGSIVSSKESSSKLSNVSKSDNLEVIEINTDSTK